MTNPIKVQIEKKKKSQKQIIDEAEKVTQSLRKLIEEENNNEKIDTLKEVLNFLTGVSDKSTLKEEIENEGGESATDEDVENLFVE